MPVEYDDDDLYHVTYYNRLSSIAKHGLVPNAAPSIGGAAYVTHKRGNIFLSEADGVAFWFSRAEAWADHHSESPGDDDLVPIVLSVLRPDDDSLKIDKPGTRDALADAYLCACEIPPDEISVYDGSAWIPISDWNIIDPELGFERIELGELYDSEEEWLEDGAPEPPTRLLDPSPLEPDL
jgi:hypothetical protein